jgi:hypothetical protein
VETGVDQPEAVVSERALDRDDVGEVRHDPRLA